MPSTVDTPRWSIFADGGKLVSHCERLRITCSTSANESVKVSVLDASFNIIWFEEITPDSMDSYSVLVIADGDGWDAGEYTIMASYGADSDTVKITVQ